MLNYDYNPLSEEEAMKARFNLLPDGDYPMIVEKSTGRMSGSGNAMAELNLKVYEKNGSSSYIKDYLLFTPSMIWKMKHFCESASLQKEYEEKKFRPELAEGKNVIGRVRVQKGKEIPEDKLNGKPPGSCYPDKNVVVDYVTKEMSIASPKNEDDFIDDKDIPF